MVQWVQISSAHNIDGSSAKNCIHLTSTGAFATRGREQGWVVHFKDEVAHVMFVKQGNDGLVQNMIVEIATDYDLVTFRDPVCELRV